jgi:hypothetical protein
MFGCILKFEEYFGGSTSLISLVRLVDPPKYSSNILALI